MAQAPPLIAYLKVNSWSTIERPNFGYDFGGYRDGVLHLKRQNPGVQNLVLINDSSWYPVPDTNDWFRDAEAIDADFVGAATSFGIMRVSRDRYQAIEWNYDVNLRDFHYCSYALLIGPRILADPRFLTFCKRYKLSDDKKRVVRRGEMGLLILSTVARFGVSYVIPRFLHDVRKFPFLKKSPVALHRGNSDIMLDIAKGLDGKDGRIIENEMRAIRKKKFLIT